MKLLQVRCCCEASRLLGFLQVPDLRQGQSSVRFRLYEAPSHFMSMADAFNGETLRARIVSLPFSPIYVEGVCYTAIKADGVELEKLRKIPGFREAA